MKKIFIILSAVFLVSFQIHAQSPKKPAVTNNGNQCLVQCPQGPKGPQGDKGDSAPASVYFKVSSYVDRGENMRHDGQRVVAPHFICFRDENLCAWTDYNPEEDVPACDSDLDADMGTYYYDADSRPLRRLYLAQTQKEVRLMRQQPDFARLIREPTFASDIFLRVPVVTIRACADVHQILAPVLE